MYHDSFGRLFIRACDREHDSRRIGVDANEKRLPTSLAEVTGFSPDNVFRNNRYGTDRFLAPALSSSSPSAPFSLRVKIAID